MIRLPLLEHGFRPETCGDGFEGQRCHNVNISVTKFGREFTSHFTPAARAGALFRGKDGGWRVFVADHGRAREQPVKIDHLKDDYGEVLSSLDDGTGIVLNPDNALEEGDRIKVR